jgi:hypothetical protein
MGVALLDDGFEGSDFTAGAGAPDDCPASALSNLWATVLTLAIFDATAPTASRERDQARAYLATPSRDLYFALDAVGLNHWAFEAKIGALARFGWHMSPVRRAQLRGGDKFSAGERGEAGGRRAIEEFHGHGRHKR